jgi:hypothetical protein
VHKDELSKGSILDFGPKLKHPDKSVPGAIEKSTTFNPKFRFRTTDEFIEYLVTKHKKRGFFSSCFAVIFWLLVILGCLYGVMLLLENM